MSALTKIIEGTGAFLTAGGIFFFFTRVGLFGESKIDLFRDDIKLGSFSRFFYDVAQFKLAGEDKVTECWSVKPIHFNEQSFLQRRH